MDTLVRRLEEAKAFAKEALQAEPKLDFTSRALPMAPREAQPRHPVWSKYSAEPQDPAAFDVEKGGRSGFQPVDG